MKLKCKLLFAFFIGIPCIKERDPFTILYTGLIARYIMRYIFFGDPRDFVEENGVIFVA